jgi:hypothetical protein
MVPAAWHCSLQPASTFMNVRAAKGVIDADARVYRGLVQGWNENDDLRV